MKRKQKIEQGCPLFDYNNLTKQKIMDDNKGVRLAASLTNALSIVLTEVSEETSQRIRKHVQDTINLFEKQKETSDTVPAQEPEPPKTKTRKPRQYNGQPTWKNTGIGAYRRINFENVEGVEAITCEHGDYVMYDGEQMRLREATRRVLEKLGLPPVRSGRGPRTYWLLEGRRLIHFAIDPSK